MANTPTQKERLKKLRAEIESMGIVMLTWSVADIHTIRSSLTVAEAKQVLDRVRHDYDASVGVSWDYLTNLVEEMFPPPPPATPGRKKKQTV